jgi:beta-1,2-mannobiose phosphorylase / 1,2-beta-oligomannan phosphorylase
LEGDWVVTKNQKVYLFYQSLESEKKDRVFKIARSTDGLDFKFINAIKLSQPKVRVVLRNFQKLLSSRSGFFDSSPIVIENVFKLSSKYIVYYHVETKPSVFRSGYAVFDLKKRLTERSDAPIWESPADWHDKHINFIGLVNHQGCFISYWNVSGSQIYAIIYPSFKFRQSIIVPVSPKLIRVERNPIISPNQDNSWESSQTFNPGVILLDNKFRFLYRAIGKDGVSRLGYAISENGCAINERFSYPVYVHKTYSRQKNAPDFYSSGGSWGGAEDPRLVRVEDEDVVYLTYTACDGGLRVGFSSIRVDDFINGRWNWKPPICISPPNQIHKNWVIFPNKIRGHYAILHAITPKIQIEYFDNLEFNGKTAIKKSSDPQLIPAQSSAWDSRLRGAGSPPIKTDYGWLMFYHAMDYKVGVMLLDLDDPTKIIYRAKAPVLESVAHYETNGIKPGIIYVSGAVIKDGTLYVYYGGADNYVCVATANIDQFLTELKQEQPVVLESAIINQII